MNVPRLDDIQFLFGDLLGGADVMDATNDPFSNLRGLTTDQLRSAIIREYVLPAMMHATDDTKHTIISVLSYILQQNIHDSRIERQLDSYLLPIEIPKPYQIFFREIFEASFPGQKLIV